jgi:hypothetical protein
VTHNATSRRRRPIRLRASFAAAACLAAAWLAAGGALSSGASSPAPSGAFVAATDGPALAVYSASTGRRIERLATFPALAWTNNGLARTPDGRAVYFTLIPRRSRPRFSLRLMRIDVAIRRQTFVADGWQPAVSDNGAQLAYGAVPHGLAVRELASRRTRTIALTRQLGPAADLLDASITWLANGSDVAILAASPFIAVAGRRKPNRLGGACGPGHQGVAIVFVHVPPAPAPLSARSVPARLLGPVPKALGSSASAPGSLLAATEWRGRTVLERIAPTGNTTQLASFPDSLAMAIDRSGTRMLYLLGHPPPALWEATIAPGHLTDRRRLIADSRLDVIAW